MLGYAPALHLGYTMYSIDGSIHGLQKLAKAIAVTCLQDISIHWLERGTAKIQCLFQEHKTMALKPRSQTQIALFRVHHDNNNMALHLSTLLATAGQPKNNILIDVATV